MLCLRVLLALPLTLSLLQTADAEEEQATQYEIAINGEFFVVDGNREVTLKSKKNKGAEYKVAVRLAQVQRWALNNVRFDYDLGFDVEDDGEPAARTAKLSHELKFTLSVTDLGSGLSTEARQEVLDKLVEAMTGRLTAEKSQDVKASEPFEKKLKKVALRGVEIDYADANGFSRGCIIYLAVADKQCCACTLEFFMPDKDDAQAIADKTIGSLRGR